MKASSYRFLGSMLVQNVWIENRVICSPSITARKVDIDRKDLMVSVMFYFYGFI